MDIEKLHERFNKRWIGRLYGYSIFFILASFGGILEFAFDLIYLWLWLVVIGYAIALPIGLTRDYLKKHKEEIRVGFVKCPNCKHMYTLYEGDLKDD